MRQKRAASRLMRRNRIIKILVAGLVLLLGVSLAGLEYSARLYREQAGFLLQEQFKSKSDLVLEPFETSVSVWRHFPRVTFVFNHISIRDTVGPGPDLQVLSIRQAEVAVPLGQYRLDRLQISRVDLTDVLFHQRTDSLGNKSGLRFKPVPKDSVKARGGLPFLIPKLVINGARIINENFYKKDALSLNLDRADLKLQVQNRKLDVIGTLNGQIGSLRNKRVLLFRQEPFTGNLHYEYFLDQKLGKLSDTDFLINKNTIQISGSHQVLAPGKGMNMNMRITGFQPVLYVLTQLIPNRAKLFLDHVKTDSRLRFALRITGVTSPKLRPRNTIRFQMDKGDLYLPATKRLIKDVQLTGEMDNGLQHGPETSRFTLSNFSARTEQDSFRVALSIQNFLNPSFTFEGVGRLGLAELGDMVNLPFTAVEGGIMQGQVSVKGQVPLPGKPVAAAWQGKGSVKLQNATFQPVGLAVICRNVNGSLQFENNVLRLQRLNGLIGGHSFNMQATVKNFFAYLLDQPGRISSRANVQAAYLDSEWLLDEPPSQTKTLVKSRRPEVETAAQPEARPTRKNSLVDMETQLKLQVGRVNLPIDEHVRKVVVQVNQYDERVTLTHMRFISPGGGVATANGGFRYYGVSGLRAPYLNVQLEYPELNLQAFMQKLADLKNGRPKAKPNATPKPGVKKEAFYSRDDYRLNLQVKTRRLLYLYLEGTNVTLLADLNSQRVKISRLDLKTAGGELHVRGTMQLNGPYQVYPLDLRAELHEMDLSQLFQMAEQMELDVLSSQNIRGKVACQVAALTSLDETFSPGLDRTVAYVKANFKQLELIEVAPIQQALRLLREERTRHLYFENVNTSFLLRHNEILSPGLRLNSNLTAFQLAGTYTMGGAAELNMDVNILPVLFGNNKRRIERIQADSTTTNSKAGRQHLLLQREQNKFKVKLSNRKLREQRMRVLKTDFQNILQQYRIDTVFSMHE